MAVIMNNRVFLVVSPCTSERYRHFRKTYCLHLQSRRVGQARNKQKQVVSFEVRDVLYYKYDVERESTIALKVICVASLPDTSDRIHTSDNKYPNKQSFRVLKIIQVTVCRAGAQNLSGEDVTERKRRRLEEKKNLRTA
jgi:hypothetical protein